MLKLVFPTLVLAVALWPAQFGCDKYSPQEGEAGDAPATPVPAPIPAAGPPAPETPPRQSASAEPAGGEPAQPTPSAQTTGSSREASTVPEWHPLLDAAAGEWAEYETLDRRRLRYEVTKVAPSGVATRVTVTENGRTWGDPAIREDEPRWDPIAAEARRHNALRTMARESLRVGGRTWDAILYEDRWLDEQVQYVRRTWVHPQVPCFGSVRMELRGDGELEALLELVDHGSR